MFKINLNIIFLPSWSLSFVLSGSLSLLELSELELRKSFKLPQSIPQFGSSNCNCIFNSRLRLCLFSFWCLNKFSLAISWWMRIKILPDVQQLNIWPFSCVHFLLVALIRSYQTFEPFSGDCWLHQSLQFVACWSIALMLRSWSRFWAQT